tara:strand:- start:162 stop:434 length:273 start_codon:yes stop_codon:yes gene_type:complete
MRMKIKFIVILYFLSTFLIAGAKAPLKHIEIDENIQTIEYKIKNGDTLWTIATEFNYTNHEKFIYIVKNLNNLDESILLVDQILILPSNI